MFQAAKFLFNGTCLKHMYIAILQIDKHFNKNINIIIYKLENLRINQCCTFYLPVCNNKFNTLFVALFKNSFTLYS